jgi:hypothetical protein
MDEILKSLQTSVFSSETPPAMDVYHVFLAELNKAIRISGLSRPAIADRMNDAIGGECAVSHGKLNKWFSPGTDQYMPVHFLPALLWAVSSVEPANALLKPLLYKAVDQRGQLFQQYAELSLDAADKKHAADQMAAELIRLTRPE